ncbi:hypothetical protein [Tenacibaculum singaporense]|uniref:hypothetical protein n=1 Tax=Tenacibaculum singaporense TaxID=2358479 RepID=UPI00351276CC
MTKTNYSLIAIVIFSIFNMGCSNAQKIEKEVLEASKNWISNFNNGNTTEVSNAYTVQMLIQKMLLW